MNKELVKSIMDVKDPTINTIVGVIGTMVTCLLGKWDDTIQILAILILADYITGMAKGYFNKELASCKGFKGLLKKGAIFMVIMLAHQMDLVTNADAPIFRTMCIYFYIGNESLSLVENLSALGVPIPKFISKYLKQLQSDNDDVNINSHS